VAIRLLDYPGEAALAHEAGLVALAIKQASQLIKSLRKSLLAGNELTLAFAAVEVDRKQLVEDVIAAVAHQRLRGDGTPALTRRRLRRGSTPCAPIGTPRRPRWQGSSVRRSAWTAARTAATRLGSQDYVDSQQDCWRNMATLLASDTVRYAGSEWLAQYPRYARAAEHRISRLNGQYLKDQKALQLLTPWTDKLEVATKQYPGLLRLSDEAYVSMDARGISGVAVCAANEDPTAGVEQAPGTAVAAGATLDGR
jgi:ATP-dependent helicase HrpA